MMMSLVGLLHRWALKLTRERVAALMAPVLVLLSGGFGWWAFLGEAAKSDGVFGLLGNLQHDYTVMGHIGYQWGNAVTALFVTQRSILLGVSLAVVVLTLWWEASEKEKVKRQKASRYAEGKRQKVKGKSEDDAAALVVESCGVGKKGAAGKKKAKGKAAQRSAVKLNDDAASTEDTFAFCLSPFAFTPMITAGIVAGLLPLAHAHSFVVVMLMGACLALMQGASVLLIKDGKNEAREDGAVRAGSLSRFWAVLLPWVAFAAAASLLALPQMFWATRETAVRAGQFFGWDFGWAHG
ncbi:MAG TPA: hypothetical protein VE821_02235, partial [Pyrinomonadaceae bacterium]|nr:hypothetical protein [Pyrinomonadaceae bacterium]